MRIIAGKLRSLKIETIEGVDLLSYFKSLEIADYFVILIESH